MSVKLKIYDIEGKVKGELTLETIPDGFVPNKNLIARSIRRQQSNARVPRASAKTRAEVKGSNAKIYRQKGTGRARHGDRKAPIFKGGGVAFGPKSERNFEIGMNKKERKAALRQIVWSKIQDGN